MSKFGFDPAEYADPVNNFNPVPPGDYILKALEAEEMSTRAGDGQYIKVKFEVSRGELKGRKIFMNFNVVNPNETAQRIGREQLAAWARACGKPKANDTDQLLEVEFQAKVGIEKGKGEYLGRDNNRINEFVPKEGVQAPAQTTAKEGTQAPSTKAADKTPPAGKSQQAAATKNPWDD